MSPYLEQPLADGSEIEKQLRADRGRYGAHVLRTLTKLGSTDEQSARVSSLIGRHQPVGAATEADLMQLPFRHERTVNALKQLHSADERRAFHFRRYRISREERAQFDLRSAKKWIEPFLKREFDAYLAKFMVDESGGSVELDVRVIGLKGDCSSIQAIPRAKRRSSKAEANFVAQEAMELLSTEQELTGISAAFWAPPTVPTYDEKSAPDVDRRALTVEAMVVRALMPLDRICFGHGHGKLAMRSIIGEIRARAVGLDLLAQSSLQPEGITSLLATLPVDKRGRSVTLPTIRLP